MFKLRRSREGETMNPDSTIVFVLSITGAVAYLGLLASLVHWIARKVYAAIDRRKVVPFLECSICGHVGEPIMLDCFVSGNERALFAHCKMCVHDLARDGKIGTEPDRAKGKPTDG